VRDRLYIGLIAIGLSVFGWLVLNGQHFPSVHRIIAPRYYEADLALERLVRGNTALSEGDPGFSELAGVMKTLMSKNLGVEITRIKSLGSAQEPMNRADGLKQVGYLSLEIHFRHLPPEVWQMGGLDLAIKQRYFPLNTFLWGSLIFGIGLLLSLVALLIKE
jgi:hypothetical protein